MLFFCNQCRVNLEAYITVDHIWLWMCSPVPIMTWSNQIYTRWLWPPSILGPWGQTEVSQDQPWPQTTATMWWSPASWMVSFFFEGHFHQERRTICWMFLEKQDQFERFVAMLQVSFDTELSPCSLAFHLPRHQGLRHPLPCLAWPSHPRRQQRRWGGEKKETSYELYLKVMEGEACVSWSFPNGHHDCCLFTLPVRWHLFEKLLLIFSFSRVRICNGFLSYFLTPTQVFLKGR